MSQIPNPSQFALAGNAVFTLQSLKTGMRFTYKVRAAPDNQALHFVSVLTGPDNINNYVYLGFIRRGVYFHGGHKTKIHPTANSAKAFHWFWQALARGAQTPSLEIHHEGRCGRCGRALTVPESIKSGFGPECLGKL
jgi:hypothetical protein